MKTNQLIALAIANETGGSNSRAIRKLKIQTTIQLLNPIEIRPSYLNSLIEKLNSVLKILQILQS
ncbi:hypothetical protein [Pedobacter ureilyticus]|uniref:Uncharacterized protein n=1 Tax=Pedobacter ureilyticus TaxID=1393051 RepID=A0ABW9J9R4_9SPHI|nr:hypothetical protein [Pedobacter helvus]